MPFLSVIIPVYKVENYLNQCVDSVINQNLEDIEIILVDDGSPDNCPQICDDYAKKYSYIKVIHKKNGGQSSARNVGIAAAQGEYLIFMDSDDWWNSDVSVNDILNYVREKPKTEMLLFTSYDYVEGEGYYKRKEHNYFNSIDVSSTVKYYSSLARNGNWEVSANTKVFKKDFILKNKLFFDDSLVCEDNEWMIRILRIVEFIEKIELPLYICRIGRKDSVTNSIGKKSITGMLDIVDKSMHYYIEKENDISDFIRINELSFCSYLWFCAMGLCTRLSKDEKKEVRSLFKETSSVCKYSNSKKTKLSKIVYKIFGFNFTVAILGKYIKIKGNNRNLKYSK